MARPTIIIGDGPTAFTFEVSPTFTPTVTTLRNSNGLRLGSQETWPVRGILINSGITDNVAEMAALKLKLETEEVNCYWKQGATTLGSLLVDDSERGPKFSGVNVIESKGGWVTHVQYAFNIIAERWDTPSGVITNEFTTANAIGAGGREVITKSGIVTTKLGASAQAAAEASAPSVPSGFKLITENVTPDFDDTHASYSYALQELFRPLPSGVRQANRNVVLTKQGTINTFTGSATFVADNANIEETKQAAQDWIDAEIEKADAAQFTQSISTNEDQRTVGANFAFQVPGEDAGNLISWKRTISLTGGLRSHRYFPIDGKEGLLFKGAKSLLVLIDAGEIVWKGPDFPFPPRLEIAGFTRDERQMIHTSPNDPRPDKDGNYPISWSFRYISTDSSAGDDIDYIDLLTSGDEKLAGEFPGDDD